jgi:hypothetical protein
MTLNGGSGEQCYETDCGRRAILLQAAKQYSNHVALDYRPEGIRYKLVLSLAAIEPAPDAPAHLTRGVTAAIV